MNHSVTQFQVEQLRLKNIWKEMEFIAVTLMIIFVNALLPQLLLQYVYANAELFETPQALQIIPVVSFVVGVLMFVYVGVGNLRREAQARRLELSMTTDNNGPRVASASTSQLQAAMKSLETKTEKSSPTRKAVKLESARSTRSKKTAVKRKNK